MKIGKPEIKRAANGSNYRALLEEAAEVERQHRARSTGEAFRLTPEAYLRHALNAASSSVERLDWLEGEIFKRPELGGVVRKFEIAIRGPNWPQPPRESRRLSHLTTVAEEAALIAMRSSLIEAFALAARNVARTTPEAFGECEDARAGEQELIELTLKRDQLFERLEKEFSASDLDFSEPDSQGNSRVTLKVSNGAIPIGPRLGERLVHWHLKQDRA